MFLAYVSDRLTCERCQIHHLVVRGKKLATISKILKKKRADVNYITKIVLLNIHVDMIFVFGH